MKVERLIYGLPFALKNDIVGGGGSQKVAVFGAVTGCKRKVQSSKSTTDFFLTVRLCPWFCSLSNEIPTSILIMVDQKSSMCSSIAMKYTKISVILTLDLP